MFKTDRRGIAVRTEAGLFDGQMALYGLREGEVFKPALLTNYLNQVAHGVRRYRNHASIFAWNMENEIVFINARNFGWLKAVEPGIKAASDLIASMDRQGISVTVEGSGSRKRSLRMLSSNPAMELPSKATPSSKARFSSWGMIARFFCSPKISKKARRMNFTFSSSTRFRISSYSLILSPSLILYSPSAVDF